MKAVVFHLIASRNFSLGSCHSYWPIDISLSSFNLCKSLLLNRYVEGDAAAPGFVFATAEVTPLPRMSRMRFAGRGVGC